MKRFSEFLLNVSFFSLKAVLFLIYFIRPSLYFILFSLRSAIFERAGNEELRVLNLGYKHL